MSASKTVTMHCEKERIWYPEMKFTAESGGWKRKGK